MPYRIVQLALIAVASTACLPTRASDDVPNVGSDADRLLARLEYVRADYGEAVVNGKVVDEHEFEEQEEMIEDAVATARALPLSDATRAALDGIGAAVERKAPAEQVTTAIAVVSARLREELWAELAAPDPSRLHDGARLYAAHCAACHGARGEGPPAAMAALKPPPRALATPEVSAGLSPRRVFAAVTFGVPDTAMPSHADTLSDAERWALGFYVTGMMPDSGPSAARPARAGGSAPPAPTSSRWTLEELAELSNEALASPSSARTAATRAAAASPLRPLRALARQAAGPDGAAALKTLREGWRVERARHAAAHPAATARVDTALDTLTRAPAPARRDAAVALVDALTELERGGR